MKFSFKSELYERLFKFIIPFILAGIGVFTLYMVVDDVVFPKLFFLMLVYFIPPLGKESIIPIGILGGKLQLPLSNEIITIVPIDPFIMAISIAFVDIMVALFLVWNYDLIKYIPIINNVVEKIENKGKSSASKYAWIKPLEFIGIVLFVIVPFQGSGGFFGSVVGRLIGMKPWKVFSAVFIGSILSTFMVAYFFESIYTIFLKNILIGLFVIFIITVLIVFIILYLNNKKN